MNALAQGTSRCSAPDELEDSGNGHQLSWRARADRTHCRWADCTAPRACTVRFRHDARSRQRWYCADVGCRARVWLASRRTVAGAAPNDGQSAALRPALLRRELAAQAPAERTPRALHSGLPGYVRRASTMCGRLRITFMSESVLCMLRVESGMTAMCGCNLPRSTPYDRWTMRM